MIQHEEAAREWLERFLGAYYLHRPVNATFVGIHDYDDDLPDYSDVGLARTVDDMASLLDSAPSGVGAPALDLDVRIARGFLRGQSWEFGSRHGPLGNPALYTGEAVFGVMSLFLNSDHRDFSARASAAVKRLERIPQLLRQGRENLSSAPAHWTRRALRECEGGLALLSDGLPKLASEAGHAAPDEPAAGWLEAIAAATESFTDFAAHLESVVLPNDTEAYSAGAEALDLMIRDAHFLRESADDIAEYAAAEMAKAAVYLDEHAGDFSAATPAEALTGLAALHPSVDGYLGRFASEWDRIREIAEANDLLTWPDFPIEYVPRPEWTRAAAPYLYFLFYRSPAACDRPPVHQYLVTPIEPTMPAEEQESLLRANNDSTILLNHVIHHGSVGHHVQNWHAFRADSRIGRMAAVDCAARTAMLSAGTMAEGWACYATDLMAEFGALTPLQQYAERHSRVRMCARAIVDVRLHQGRMSFDRAVDFYQETAGMSQAAATSEVTKNSMFPGGALMYLMGTDGIHALRRELSARSGFSLKRFHDRFLSFGSVPVALAAERMLEETPE